MKNVAFLVRVSLAVSEKYPQTKTTPNYSVLQNVQPSDDITPLTQKAYYHLLLLVGWSFGDSTPASALPIVSSRELLAQFFEVPIYKNVSIGYSLTKILSIQRSTGYKRKEIATSAEFNII